MESVGAMLDGEWSSFNGVYSTEEADFMAQLLGNCSLPNEVPSSSSFGFSSAFWPNQESEYPIYSSDETSVANMYSFSQGSSYSGGSTSFCPVSLANQYHLREYQRPILMRNDSSVSINHYTTDGKNTIAAHQMYTKISLIQARDEFLNQDVSNDTMDSAEAVPEEQSLQLGRQHEMQAPETSFEDKEDSLSETSNKRPRIPMNVKNKRIVKPKKNEKLNSSDNNDESNKPIPVLLRQRSSSNLSEDDSSASHEFNGEAAAPMSNPEGANTAINLSGKTRASRGSATDPQSLYARKRRERINERLRILQNLVPNGTKVDISTMLEEAAQYVKFLQLQVKLLSSDDLWMYAPIAYNGMDIGLDLRIGTPKS